MTVTYTFNNKAAIVTGAGSGIGRAVALALGAAGAAVAVNDINPDRAAQVGEQITQAGGRAIDVDADVSNRFQAASIIERARDAFGQIHILVNAAGVYKADALAKLDEWDWRRIVDVNLTGTFFCNQLIGRVMADEGGGTIVNLASAARTLETGVAYISTKAGIIGMTAQLARELAPAGVRVNAVCAGSIEGEEETRATTPNNLQGRFGTAQEVAPVVLFLCSDAASFMTGQAIHVDGGAHLL